MYVADAVSMGAGRCGGDAGCCLITKQFCSRARHITQLCPCCRVMPLQLRRERQLHLDYLREIDLDQARAAHIIGVACALVLHFFKQRWLGHDGDVVLDADGELSAPPAAIASSARLDLPAFACPGLCLQMRFVQMRLRHSLCLPRCRVWGWWCRILCTSNNSRW